MQNLINFNNLCSKENFNIKHINQIEKKVYYCWFGGDKSEKVLSCMKNWREKLPDYEIIEINESSNLFDIEQECKNNVWFRACYERKMWAYVADYVRLKVLYQYGGVYLDTDITIEKDLCELLEKNKLVLGWEDCNGINAAVIIVPPKNKLIKEMLDFYNYEIWKSPLYTIPTIILKVLKRRYILNNYNMITENEDILLLPPEYFYPMPFGQNSKKEYVTENSFTVHWWDASWFKPEVFLFMEYKNQVSLDKIDNFVKEKCMATSKNSFIENIFSIKNAYDRRSKVITLLWKKIRVKRK